MDNFYMILHISVKWIFSLSAAFAVTAKMADGRFQTTCFSGGLVPAAKVP